MKPLRILTLTILAAFFSVFLLLPLYSVVKNGLNPAVLAECFRNPIYVEGLLNSLKIALVTTALTFVTYDPALIMIIMILPGKNWLTPDDGTDDSAAVGANEF